VRRPIVLLLGLAACRTTGGGVAQVQDERPPAVATLGAGGEGALAIAVGKLLTLDDQRSVHDPGLVLIDGGKIRYAGPPIEVPPGYERLVVSELWAWPGMVDLHTHIHSAGWHDLNDTVHPLNPGLRVRPALDPWDERLEHARAAGVTTLFGIPGSGSSNGGFGVVYKPLRDGGYEGVVLRDPGGMKIAQNFNPQRYGGDLGASWCGLAWTLEELNDRVAAQVRAGQPVDWQLQDLAQVHEGDLPVLIHCASAEGVADAVRMWKLRYGAEAVVSHGCWDGWYAAPFAAATGTPCNLGPRIANLQAMRREGRVVGIAAEYEAVDVPQVSLNTDSPIVPEEELFLQGTVSARLGAEPYAMLEALTRNPAGSFLLASRVGSLEAGRDADLVLTSGDPLDPRSRIEYVFIDGRLQYSRAADGPIL
jgi:imidazolonepropionase-like amidohydrolase